MTEDRLLEIVKETDDGCAPYYGVLAKLIKDRQYKSGIEIGVLFGGHALSMLKSNSLQLLIGVDPYKIYEQAIHGLETQEDFDAAYVYAMNRLSTERYWHFKQTSDVALSLIKNIGYLFDFIFIDGLHTYDQLSKDLSGYSPLIKKGGVIACHDYNHPNFSGLTLAIDEFALKNNTKVIICPFHAIYMEKTW